MFRNMDKDTALLNKAVPSASPTPEELEQWHALPRDEQERRFAQAIKQGFQSPPVANDIDAIIAEARAGLKLPIRG